MRRLTYSLLALPLLLSLQACSDEDANVVASPMGVGECVLATDCGADELCVHLGGEGAYGSCVEKCATPSDVCPGTSVCTAVQFDEESDLACIPLQTVVDTSWRTCGDARECAIGERCVNLGSDYGVRCVPSCDDAGACQDPRMLCGLDFELEGEEALRGCGQPCTESAHCDEGWTCRIGASGDGLCIR